MGKIYRSIQSELTDHMNRKYIFGWTYNNFVITAEINEKSREETYDGYTNSVCKERSIKITCNNQIIAERSYVRSRNDLEMQNIVDYLSYWKGQLKNFVNDPEAIFD